MKFHRRADEASCREVSRTLQAYLDGHVDEVTARRVARHLEACRRCGLEAEVYTRIKEALSRMDRDVSSLAVARLRDFARRLAEDGPLRASEPPA
jgi:anti-sigma factor (TIGR02949 family)